MGHYFKWTNDDEIDFARYGDFSGKITLNEMRQIEWTRLSVGSPSTDESKWNVTIFSLPFSQSRLVRTKLKKKNGNKMHMNGKAYTFVIEMLNKNNVFQIDNELESIFVCAFPASTCSPNLNTDIIISKQVVPFGHQFWALSSIFSFLTIKANNSGKFYLYIYCWYTFWALWSITIFHI